METINKKKAFVTIKEAATKFGKSPHNIKYLIDYHASINKYNSKGKIITDSPLKESVYVSLKELQSYFKKYNQVKDDALNNLGVKNPELEFGNLSDAERTKHVHILHPYVGKFIPQLVEYYLKKHFKKGNFILDPFAGSGTTLVEANVLGLNSVGIELSPFNCKIIKTKIQEYDIELMTKELEDILMRLAEFSYKYWKDPQAEKMILKFKKIKSLAKKSQSLSSFTNTGKFHKKRKKSVRFTITPEKLYEESSEYMKNWFAKRSVAELEYYHYLIDREGYKYKDLMKTIVTRAARSSRMVKHIDLTHPKEPLKEGEEYVCRKHRNRICIPINQAFKHIKNYTLGANGAINRLSLFHEKFRKNVITEIIEGNSENISLSDILTKFKFETFDGIFTSPPYVGVLDYHEQHEYAYQLLRLEKRESEEIGISKNGTSNKAKKAYIKSISNVLINLKQYLRDNSRIFFVANDKHNLYPEITKRSGYSITEVDERPVFKRASMGGAKSSYSEKIFHLKIK